MLKTYTAKGNAALEDIRINSVCCATQKFIFGNLLGTPTTITLSSEENKLGFEEIGEKTFLPSPERAGAKCSSSCSKEENDKWNSIYKNRAKLMVGVYSRNNLPVNQCRLQTAIFGADFCLLRSSGSSAPG